MEACRWYRDPTLPLPRTEVTRFPHGVLEVKLSLPEGQKAPEWVQDLLDSGYLTEVSNPEQACPQLVDRVCTVCVAACKPLQKAHTLLS